jgi:hypothetical protein
MDEKEAEPPIGGGWHELRPIHSTFLEYDEGGKFTGRVMRRIIPFDPTFPVMVTISTGVLPNMVKGFREWPAERPSDSAQGGQME